MKRKVKFQEGGPVEEPAPAPARRQSLITNEPVGARLGRFLRGMFETPAPTGRGRGGNPRGMPSRRTPGAATPSASAAAAAAARRAAPNSGVGDAEGTPVAATQRRTMGQTSRPRPAARPAPRQELTMEEIRALRSGERAPRTSEERALREGLRDLPQPRQRMSEADELNERELRLNRARRQAEQEFIGLSEDEVRLIRAQRQADAGMGGSGNIGAASARERGEQVGPPGDYNMKRGGMVPAPKAVVKKKAGGMIAAKPKAAPAKMKKGGAVAKPKGKPMPFKKGGVIKKGRK